MEIAIERLVALCCVVIGLSHMFQARAWVRLFIHWREKGDVGALYAGLLHFQMGALIVSFHTVWHGIPTIVTLLGWGWTIKGFLYLTYPKLPMRVLARISVDRWWEFAVAGTFLLAIGILIAYSLFTRGVLL